MLASMVSYKGNMQNFAVCVTSNSISKSGVLFRNFRVEYMKKRVPVLRELLTIQDRQHRSIRKFVRKLLLGVLELLGDLLQSV